MAEADFMRWCMNEATRLGARLFRMNTGQAWVGNVMRNRDGSITIKNPRPFRAGVTGMHDLIGWTPVEVTQEMVGTQLAVFTSIETKSTKGCATVGQANFLAAVTNAGGKSGIARKESDLTAILYGECS